MKHQVPGSSTWTLFSCALRAASVQRRTSPKEFLIAVHTGSLQFHYGAVRFSPRLSEADWRSAYLPENRRDTMAHDFLHEKSITAPGNRVDGRIERNRPGGAP